MDISEAAKKEAIEAQIKLADAVAVAKNA